jgi:putative ABC transport system permease protein
MMRSVVALGRVDPGWNPSNVVAMSISTVGTSAADSTRHAAFFADALARVQALPGVASASYINHLPIAGDVWGFPFTIDGQPRPRPGEAPTATYRVVFPGYFHTMRIPIVRGRDIGASDREGAPGVVVVNEYMAARHWPHDDALGKRIAVDGSMFTIVGIVKNDVRDSWSAPPEEEMFLPFYQQPAYVNGAGPRAPMTLVARVACRRAECDAGAIAPAIEAAVRGADPNVPISAVQTMSSVVAGATAESRFYLTLLGAFASIAVLLAGVGVYGVMSYSVSRRTREIGLRIALGAEPNALLRGIVRQGVALAATGACAGVVAALLLTRLMSGLLYGVTPTDVMTFVAVPVTLCAVALVAALVPARRATKIDPLVALRAE